MRCSDPDSADEDGGRLQSRAGCQRADGAHGLSCRTSLVFNKNVWRARVVPPLHLGACGLSSAVLLEQNPWRWWLRKLACPPLAVQWPFPGRRELSSGVHRFEVWYKYYELWRFDYLIALLGGILTYGECTSKKQNQHVSTIGFFLSKDLGLISMWYLKTYYISTKQNKTTQNLTIPKSWSSWLTTILRFVQSSLTVIETEFFLLFPNDQFFLISMTRRDWGQNL